MAVSSTFYFRLLIRGESSCFGWRVWHSPSTDCPCGFGLTG